jgi:hypothetical protein
MMTPDIDPDYQAACADARRVSQSGDLSMTSFKILAATLILSNAIATPVFAQAAVQEPGAAAFYHPDADILHAGSTPAPYAFAPHDAFASLPPLHRSHFARARTGSHSAFARAHRSVRVD